MNLTISGHHLEVTPAIREYVQSKLERVKRHFDQVIDIAVILTVDNLTEKEKRQKAEINLRLPGKTVNVASLSHDLYAAIDCPDRQARPPGHEIQIPSAGPQSPGHQAPA